MGNDFGILSYGAYLPRLRLQRKAIAAANAWFAPGLRGLAKGERAMAGWDEDSITMAVEAARDCLAGRERSAVGQLMLASTTHPYDDRQNAGIVANALNLGSALAVLDVTGSQRAATSALATALASGSGKEILVAAGEHRRAKAASTQEMHYGDGAAAILVGTGKPVARLLGAHSETVDFVDHFRGSDAEHDYSWEERWVRDEGYLKIVPRALEAVLKAAAVKPESITHFCMPCTLSRVAPAVAKRAGIAEGAVRDTLAAVAGDTGAAHPLVLLVHALQEAKPGDRILVAAFGQGCDAMLFEVTDAISQLASRRGVKGSLARRKEESNYAKFLAFNDHIALERGMRAETDKQHAADDAVPQPRHGDRPGRRALPRVRHAAVSERPLLRESEVQRARFAGAEAVLRRAGERDVVHRRLGSPTAPTRRTTTAWSSSKAAGA